MPDFHEVAMFQAAVQKNKSLLPKPDKHSKSKSQATNKDAMVSEVTLVEGGNASQSQQKDPKGKWSRSSGLSPDCMNNTICRAPGEVVEVTNGMCGKG